MMPDQIKRLQHVIVIWDGNDSATTWIKKEVERLLPGLPIRTRVSVFPNCSQFNDRTFQMTITLKCGKEAGYEYIPTKYDMIPTPLHSGHGNGVLISVIRTLATQCEQDERHRAAENEYDRRRIGENMLLTRMKKVLAEEFPNLQNDSLDRLMHDVERNGKMTLPYDVNPKSFNPDLVRMTLTFPQGPEGLAYIVLTYDAAKVLWGMISLEQYRES